MNLKFLGTGGGRYTMIKQLRRTGGMFLEHGNFSVHIDPGPGALVHAGNEGIELEELDAVMVTHAHLDHYGDMNAIIEAMTEGGDREEGRLLASESVLEGAEIPEKYTEGEGTYGEKVPPALDSYHERLVPEITVLEDGKELDLGPFNMRCLETEHSDPRTVAFRLEKEGRSYGFVTDTELFDRLKDFFSGSDVLVINLMRPHDHEWKGHLNTEDAAELLEEVEPELAVMQHFGAALIYGSVDEEREWLEDQTDVDFVMAEDGMELDLEQPEKGLERYL
ncbi:MAG: MBL fold metallo-hydrolase, partial [Candidatus Nanohaloarchaea archaeon]|nr:MBL fold metallo-hydrolase [Candidatus Nanohaloarchaea archaeon]